MSRQQLLAALQDERIVRGDIPGEMAFELPIQALSVTEGGGERRVFIRHGDLLRVIKKVLPEDSTPVTPETVEKLCRDILEVATVWIPHIQQSVAEGSRAAMVRRLFRTKKDSEMYLNTLSRLLGDGFTVSYESPLESNDEFKTSNREVLVVRW